jgi:hypothetical protein
MPTWPHHLFLAYTATCEVVEGASGKRLVFRMTSCRRHRKVAEPHVRIYEAFLTQFFSITCLLNSLVALPSGSCLIYVRRSRFSTEPMMPMACGWLYKSNFDCDAVIKLRYVEVETVDDVMIYCQCVLDLLFP